MIKRLLALTLTLVMLLSITSNNVLADEMSTATTPTFTDMPDDWSTEALERAVSNGLINGYNNRIMPKNNLTRAEMGTIINRAFGAKKMGSLAGYRDVPVDAWYYTEMKKAVYVEGLQRQED